MVGNQSKIHHSNFTNQPPVSKPTAAPIVFSIFLSHAEKIWCGKKTNWILKFHCKSSLEIQNDLLASRLKSPTSLRIKMFIATIGVPGKHVNVKSMPFMYKKLNFVCSFFLFNANTNCKKNVVACLHFTMTNIDQYWWRKFWFSKTLAFWL